MKFLYLGLIALVLASSSMALANISACGTINAADTYRLNTSLTSSGNCLVITATDVAIDGMGYTISGDGTGTGIDIKAERTNVSNIMINGFDFGITIAKPNNHVVNNSALNNSNIGFYLYGPSDLDNNTFSGNSAYNNTNKGFAAYANSATYLIDNLVMTNNTASGNGVSGFELKGIEYCNFSRNSLYNNNMLLQDSGVSNLIYDNIFSHASVLLAGSSGSYLFNTTKQAGTNIIGGANIGGNYWADTPVYDTDNDSIGNGPVQAIGPTGGPIGPFYDYLPLTNLLGGYFMTPTPSGIIASAQVQVAFRFTLYNMTSCQVELNGANQSGTLDLATNQTCYYNFTTGSFIENDVKGWANVSGVYYPTNETRVICLLGCSSPSGGMANPPANETNATQSNATLDQTYYSNPPDTLGQPALIGISDSIVEDSGGTIGSLPYTCAPTVQNIAPFIGSALVDKFICELKGLLSLYFKRLSIFANATMFALVLIAVFINTEGRQSYQTSKEKNIGNALIFSAIIVFVLGFDFVAFMTTAFLLFAGGHSLGLG